MLVYPEDGADEPVDGWELRVHQHLQRALSGEGPRFLMSVPMHSRHIPRAL